MTALYAVAFLSSLGFSVVLPFMVPLVVRLGGSAITVGALSALFWSAQLLGSTWLGVLSDRIGRKRVLLRSQLGAMAAWLIFLAALSAPMWPLVLIGLSRITDGVFNGSVSVANAYVADLADGNARKLHYARLGAATSLGFVVGPVLAGFVARSDAGMRVVVVLALALSGIATVLIRYRLPALPLRPAAALEVVRAGGVHTHKLLGGGCGEAVRHSRWHLRAILARRELRPLIALYFVIYFAFSMFVAAMQLHAVVDLGCTARMLGFVYATLALSLTCTQAFVLPPLARAHDPPMIAAIGGAVVVGAYVVMSVGGRPELVAGGVLYGLGNGLMWPSFLTILSYSGPPEMQGAVQGVGSSTGSFASIIGTVIGAAVFVVAGVVTFYLAAAAIAVATAIFVDHAIAGDWSTHSR